MESWVSDYDDDLSDSSEADSSDENYMTDADNKQSPILYTLT